MSLRHEERGHRARVFARILADDVESPFLNSRSSRSRVPIVPEEYVLDAFLVQHPHRLTQPEQKIGCGRIRKKTAAILFEDRTPVPVVPRECRASARRDRLLGQRIEPETWRQHQALL